MKTTFITILLFITAVLNTTAQKFDEENFINTLKIVESENFYVKINYVYPQNNIDVSKFNPRGFIYICDSVAKAELPFFGRAYKHVPGDDAGIKFEDKMKDRVIEIKSKVKEDNKVIFYTFSARRQSDVFDVTIEIAHNGLCYVTVHSNDRESITYAGVLMTKDEYEK